MNAPIIIPITPVTLTSVILSYFSPRYQKLEAPDEKVSVIIPAYNEEKNIITCIDSLANQTKTPDEIVISNNGSTDKTKTVVEDYIRRKGCTLEKKIFVPSGTEIDHYTGRKTDFIVMDHEQKTSKSDSINFAKEHLENPKIMVVDSDTYFLKDFLKEAAKCFYILYKPKKTSKNAVIEKISAVSGTVLSDYKEDGTWKEKFISRARTLEYNMGQFLTKQGQNKLAIYVVSGCGFVADKDVLEFDSRTVTEDLNLTWKAQCEHKEDRQLSLEELASLNLYTLEGKNLTEELKEFDRKIIFRDRGRVLYQPSAFMITQDPTTFKGLAKQLDRWKGGLHQNMFLEGKHVRENSKMLTLISHATEVEGTLSSIYWYGLPIIAGLAYQFDIGINYKVPLYMMAVDSILRTFFALSGTYRCNKQLEEKHPIFKTIGQTVASIIPYYMIEYINSFEFLKTQMKTTKEVYINKRREWDPTWERVKDFEKKK